MQFIVKYHCSFKLRGVEWCSWSMIKGVHVDSLNETICKAQISVLSSLGQFCTLSFAWDAIYGKTVLHLSGLNFGANTVHSGECAELAFWCIALSPHWVRCGQGWTPRTAGKCHALQIAKLREHWGVLCSNPVIGAMLACALSQPVWCMHHKFWSHETNSRDNSCAATSFGRLGSEWQAVDSEDLCSPRAPSPIWPLLVDRQDTSSGICASFELLPVFSLARGDLGLSAVLSREWWRGIWK